MGKIQIKREHFGVHYHNDCPFCGLNTNLLAESEKVVVDSKTYCKHCYQKGTEQKNVTPSDFYMLSFGNHTAQDTMVNVSKEAVCNQLPQLEIAHFCGKYGEEGCVCLDLYHAAQEGCIYFRLSLCNDDDPWEGTETYTYLSPAQAIELLNKNGIQILDGLTDDNWDNYFDFI